MMEENHQLFNLSFKLKENMLKSSAKMTVEDFVDVLQLERKRLELHNKFSNRISKPLL